MPRKSSEIDITWCDKKAAEYACKHWHYSGSMPTGKCVCIGTWENGHFIGAVVFAHGANNNIAMPYQLEQKQCIELCRVALSDHIIPVSQIMARSLKLLKQQSPGLRLVVSYADPSHNHHGGVYQAANWIYTGAGQPDKEFIVRGKRRHRKSIHSMGVKQNIESIRKYLDPEAQEVRVCGKHKYLYPLDKAMNRQCQLLAKPYPKREKHAMTGTTGTAAGKHRPSRSITQAPL